MTSLDGFRAVSASGASAFARPEAVAWVRDALTGFGSLHEAALSAADDDDRPVLRGRGPVPLVATGSGRWAVRHYFRGGLMARILGDRYLHLGEPRPVAEARWSDEARRRGVPTPRVIAGAVYPAGLFYRADLVTEYVPDSRDLASILFPPAADAGEPEGEEGSAPWSELRHEALVLAGALIVRTAEARIYHPDLNAKNILVAREEAGLGAYLLDLDRCRADVAGPDRVEIAMIRRLERSLGKLADQHGRPLEDADHEALGEGVLSGAPLAVPLEEGDEKERSEGKQEASG